MFSQIFRETEEIIIAFIAAAFKPFLFSVS